MIFLSLVVIVLFCNVFSPPFPSPFGRMPGKSPGSNEGDYPGFTALGHDPADGVHKLGCLVEGFCSPEAHGERKKLFGPAALCWAC